MHAPHQHTKSTPPFRKFWLLANFEVSPMKLKQSSNETLDYNYGTSDVELCS